MEAPYLYLSLAWTPARILGLSALCFCAGGLFARSIARRAENAFDHILAVFFRPPHPPRILDPDAIWQQTWDEQTENEIACDRYEEEILNRPPWWISDEVIAALELESEANDRAIAVAPPGSMLWRVGQGPLGRPARQYVEDLNSRTTRS